MCTSRELKYIEWLKKSKSPYVGISLFVFMLLLFLFVVVYMSTHIHIQIFNDSVFIWGILMVGGVAFFTYKYLTRKIDHDIKNLSFKKKEIISAYIFYSDDVESGSGMLYIPILGHFFPKLWGQKMRRIKRYYIVSKEGVRYEINNQDYALLSDKSSCHFIYGQESDILVGVEL